MQTKFLPNETVRLKSGLSGHVLNIASTTAMYGTLYRIRLINCNTTVLVYENEICCDDEDMILCSGDVVEIGTGKKEIINGDQYDLEFDEYIECLILYVNAQLVFTLLDSNGIVRICLRKDIIRVVQYSIDSPLGGFTRC